VPLSSNCRIVALSLDSKSKYVLSVLPGLSFHENSPAVGDLPFFLSGKDHRRVRRRAQHFHLIYRAYVPEV